MQSDTKIKKNFDFIDVSKFFAMISVVLMHCIDDNGNMKFKLVQIGCMAYFFFASGFLFDEKNDKKSFVNYFIKNIKRLLVPYFIFAAIGVAVSLLLPTWYGQNTINDYIYAIFVKFEPIGYGLLWFLMCLFWIKIAFFILWKLLSFIKMKQVKIIILIALIIFLNYQICLLCDYYWSQIAFRLSFKLDTMMVAINYFIIGFLFRYMKIYKLFTNKFLCFVVFLITRIIATYIEINYLGITNICRFIFEYDYLIYFANQLIMILSYFAIGNVFRDVKLFGYLGRNNMYIYLIHIYALWFVEYIYNSYKGANIYAFSEWRQIIPISAVAYAISAIIASIISRQRIRP